MGLNGFLSGIFLVAFETSLFLMFIVSSPLFSHPPPRIRDPGTEPDKLFLLQYLELQKL